MGQLTAATRRVAEGESGITLPTTPADELGALAGSFNRMNERLASTVETLEAERARAETQRSGASREAALHDAVLVRVGERTLAGAARWDAFADDLPDETEQAEAAAVTASVRAAGETALAFSGRGLPEPRVESVELTRLLRAAIDAAKPAAALSETTLDLEVENALGRITTDPMRLRAVLDEVLGNAIRSTRRGTVTLRVVRRDTTSPPRVELSIVDTGVGMTKGQRQQLHRPEPQRDGGGLGLHMAGRLAASIGAQIEIDAIPGEGTTVRVDLSC
jgi:signal transduction histidine kinase